MSKTNPEDVVSRLMRGIVEGTRRMHEQAAAEDVAEQLESGEGMPNIALVEIRCGLGQRGRVREVLTEWRDNADPEQRAHAEMLLELPVVERDSYPRNRFTLCDEDGETIFVGNLHKQTLDLPPNQR